MAVINVPQGAETSLPIAPSARPAPTRPVAAPAREASPAPERSGRSWSREELEAAVERLRGALAEVRPEPYTVSIRNDEESDLVVIQIKDPDGEVVKQFPPEKILNLHQKMDDLVGMIVDETT